MNQRSPQPPKLRARQAGGGAIGFMVLLELVSGIDQGMFPVLFPTIADEFGVAPGDIMWVSALPLLCGALAVPVLAKLGDMFGHRRMLRIGCLIALAASAIMAFAPNYPAFLLGRFLLGTMAVFLPLVIAIVSDRSPGRSARRNIGLLAGALTLGVALGGLVGGYLQHATNNLRVTLLVSLGLLALCWAVAQFLIPESEVRAARRIDYAGFAGIGLGLVALQFALFMGPKWGWDAKPVIGAFAVSAVLLVLWALWELRAPEPAIDLRMLTNRSMWPIQLSAVLFGMALFGSLSSMTTFLGTPPEKAGYGLGLAPHAIGWVVLPSPVIAMVGATLNGRIADRIGLRGSMILGGLTVTTGFAALTALHTTQTQVIIATSVFGFGFGLLLASMPAFITEVAPRDSTGIAAGIYNTVRVLGGSVIGGIFSVVLSSMVLTNTKIPTEQAYQVIWIVCGAMGLLIALLTTTTRRAATDTPAPAGEAPAGEAPAGEAPSEETQPTTSA